MVAIRGIASCLGNSIPTSSLIQDGIEPALVLQLAVKGTKSFRRSTETLFEMAMSTGLKSLKRADVTPASIDVLLFSSNSMGSAEFREDISHRLLRALGLSEAYVHGVCFQNCGDGILALRTAQALVASGQAKRALVIFADRVCDAGIPRIVKNAYIHSDGASSCVVEVHAVGFQIGRCRIIHSQEEEIADPFDIEVNLDGFARRAKAMFAGEDGRGIELLVTHNINQIFNHRMARIFGLPPGKIIGFEGEGHCLASDILINLGSLEDSHGKRILVFAPTRRSYGVLELNPPVSKEAAHV